MSTATSVYLQSFAAGLTMPNCMPLVVSYAHHVNDKRGIPSACTFSPSIDALHVHYGDTGRAEQDEEFWHSIHPMLIVFTSSARRLSSTSHRHSTHPCYSLFTLRSTL